MPRQVWSAETGTPPPAPAVAGGEATVPASGQVEPAPAAPGTPERPAASGKAPRGRGAGGGAAALSFAAGMLYQWAHEGAVERRRDTEGYVPVGPAEFADEGLLSRIGRFFADPTLDSQADLSSRLNVPVWRDQVRKAAAAHRADGVLRVMYQVQFPSQYFQDVRDIEVTYTRQPDGTWRVTSVGAPFPEGTSVPDLNRIIDPGVSDYEVGRMLGMPMTA